MKYVKETWRFYYVLNDDTEIEVGRQICIMPFKTKIYKQLKDTFGSLTNDIAKDWKYIGCEVINN